MVVGAGGKLGDATTAHSPTTPTTVRTRSSCGSPRSPATGNLRRCRHAHDPPRARPPRLASESGFTMIAGADGADGRHAADRARPSSPPRATSTTRSTTSTASAPSTRRAPGSTPSSTSSTRTPSCGRPARPQATTPGPGHGAADLKYSYSRCRRTATIACSATNPVGHDDRLQPRGSFRMKFTGTAGPRRAGRRGRSSPASAATARSTTSGTRSTRRSTRTPTHDPADYQDCAAFLRDGRGRATAATSTGSPATTSTARCTRRTST